MTRPTAAAKSLVESGALGDDTREFTVALSGHSNPGHAPVPGYANDSIYVSVAQAAAPAK
jgi:hypothetical protein